MELSRDKDYQRYLKSDVWVCEDSPTGAHHWVEIPMNMKMVGTFLCKWCYGRKRFPTTFNLAVDRRSIRLRRRDD